MYFNLDENDVIHDDDGELLYRIVATEDFITVASKGNGMIRDVVSIHRGDKGGYAGSRMCLEERLEHDIKPWVFFPARISSGCILSGMSVLSGSSCIMHGSVVEGGCSVADTIVDRSRIHASKCASDGKTALLSFVSSGGETDRSEIRESVIRSENVTFSRTIVEDVRTGGGYGNIVLSNSKLSSVIISGNTRIRNTSICNPAKGHRVEIPANAGYDKGIVEQGLPQVFPVEWGNNVMTHESCWRKMNGLCGEPRGIYRKAEYTPVC